MRVVFVLLCFLICLASPGQDISGIWRGHFTSTDKMSDIFNLEERYKLELQVDQQDKLLKGITYSYLTTVFYGKATGNGTVNPATGKVRFEELKTIELKMDQGSYACVMTYYLQYIKNGDEEILEGKYSGYRESDSAFCGRGTVFLRKVTSSDFAKEPFIVKRELEEARKKQLALATPPRKPATADKAPAPRRTPGSPAAKAPLAKKPASATPSTRNPAPAILPPSATASVPQQVPDISKRERPEIPPKVLTSRSTELVRTITVRTNEIIINLYDNGTIDHDTVSVYLDKKLIVSRQMLTTSPITVKLKMDEENNYHELVMVAENLGEIPPNTSLMVVNAGDKQYEVRITSTEQRNAAVIFKYEK